MDSTIISTEEITNTVEENNLVTTNIAPSKKRQILLPDRNMEDAETNEGNSHPDDDSTKEDTPINPNHCTTSSDLKHSSMNKIGNIDLNNEREITQKEVDELDKLAKEKPNSLLRKIGQWQS
eukprot:5524331-Ditylum_brightwellii.AAC.1